MKVGLFPMKVGHDTEGSLQFIKRQSPRVFSLTEMDLGNKTYLYLVRRVFGLGSRIFSSDIRGHSQEIPIVMPKLVPWTRIEKFDVFQLSVDGGPAVGGMGNDRWAARLQLKVFRKRWVVWATHLDAGVQHTAAGPNIGALLNSPPGIERWKRYTSEIKKLYDRVSADVDDKTVDVTVLQGDFNMLPIGEGMTNAYSPHQLFNVTLDMDYVNTRVCYIFAHGAKIRKHTVFPPGQNGWGSDHGGLLAHIW